MIIEPGSKPDTSFQVKNVDPTAFFETTCQMFQKAEQVADISIERFYSIGGHIVRLRFAGSALPPLITPALEHLATEHSLTPSLTVFIWDDVSTHTRMPPPPWLGYAVYTRRGDVRGFNNDRILTAYNWEANVLTVLDKKQGIAVYWTHDARRLPSYETSAPLRTILHWCMNQHGHQFVHAGAVGTAHGGVLLAGKGGTGKSTTVLSCLNADLVYVSDDYCLLAVEPVPYAYSIYSSAKLNADTIQKVPHLMPTISNVERIDTEKAVFFLYPHFAKKIVTGFPIHAILLPRISGGLRTTLTPASSIEGLKALALSTMSQLAGTGQASLKIMNSLVHQVPCYHIELGTDLPQIPDVILSLLGKD